MRKPDADNPRVLVTGAGGPSGTSFMLALRERPGHVDFFAADIDPHAPGLYMVPAARRLLLPRGDDPDFAPALLAECAERGIDVVAPTVDSELLPLAEARERFADAGIELLLAPAEAIRPCLDKWELMRALAGAVALPRAAAIDASFDPAHWDGPALVKPRSGSGGRGVHRVEDRDQLAALPRDEGLLAQELLTGREFSVDVFASRDGEVLAVVPRERLKIDSGIAITSRTVRDENLERLGRDAVLALGLTGVSNVQAMEDANGVPRLIEINPRFPGTMPLTVAAGVNMPALAIDEALGRELPAGPFGFREVALARYLADLPVPVEELRAMERAGEGRPQAVPG